jgi:putative sterol carrier protein
LPVLNEKEKTMSSVDEIVKKMQAKFNPSAASGLDLVYQFNIDDGDNYYLAIKDKTCDLQKGDAPDPSVTLSTDSETLKGIMSGETDGMQAFMSGKLRAEGNIMLATKLGELFSL